MPGFPKSRDVGVISVTHTQRDNLNVHSHTLKQKDVHTNTLLFTIYKSD